MAEDTTGADVGSFFKGLGEGVVSIVGGFGASLNSGANYNDAIANQINSNASTSAERLEANQNREEKDRRMIIFVFIIIAVVPLLGLAMLKKS